MPALAAGGRCFYCSQRPYEARRASATPARPRHRRSPRLDVSGAVAGHHGTEMLNQLRSSAKSFVAKILIGLLVISFGIWGIADVFTGIGANEVAVAGDTEITQLEFQRDYERLVRNLGRQTGRVISPAEARQLGLPSQVLSRLVTNALLNDAARDLGLDVSDPIVAEAIRSDPTFVGAGGGFSRATFENVMASNAFNESLYIENERKALNREQLVEALIGGFTAPRPYLEALNRYQNEERTIRWITLGEDSVGPIPDPTDEELRTFFEAGKETFRAPEYRAF
jgi:peptidyl-prolyl cis-trans isomerase D